MSTDSTEIGSLAASTSFLTLGGKRFRLTIRQSDPQACHWILAIPGELVLSGDAACPEQSLREAQSAAEAWLDERRSAALSNAALALVEA